MTQVGDPKIPGLIASRVTKVASVMISGLWAAVKIGSDAMLGCLSAAAISKANIEALVAYNWPGNVRELENVIERSAILAQGGKLRIELQSGLAAKVDDNEDIMSNTDLKRLERGNLVNCMRRSQGKVSGQAGAARLLELAPTTVYSRIKALRISDADWEV